MSSYFVRPWLDIPLAPVSGGGGGVTSGDGPVPLAQVPYTCCGGASTCFVCQRVSPAGHPTPRPLPQHLVLPEFAHAAVELLDFVEAQPWEAQFDALGITMTGEGREKMLRGLSVEALQEWREDLLDLQELPQEVQGEWWLGLARLFRDYFHRDYPAVMDFRAPLDPTLKPRLDARVFTPPALYDRAVVSQEESKVRAQGGRYALKKYVRAWKEGPATSGATQPGLQSKRDFMLLAGAEEKWRVATDAQKEEVWRILRRLVVAARGTIPPETRIETQFPALWDLALADARATIPKNPDTTTQSAEWMKKVVENAQGRYPVYVRKAMDESRGYDGHRRYGKIRLEGEGTVYQVLKHTIQPER